MGQQTIVTRPQLGCIRPCMQYPPINIRSCNYNIHAWCKSLHQGYRIMIAQVTRITRALRAHTPRAPCICMQRGRNFYVVDDLYLHVRGQSCARMSREHMHKCIVGTVDGCGYDSHTICDACRPCHSILSILKQFFANFDRFVILSSR